MEFFTSLWLFIGLIAVIIEYYTTKKYFWETYKVTPSQITCLKALVIFSPIIIVGGFISYLMFYFGRPKKYKVVFYYKIKNGDKK